jgi:hypothetical protein
VQKALLDGKLEANAAADRIAVNMRLLNENPDHRFLFNDAHTLVQMDPQAFAAVVENRIAKHKAEQQRKEEEQRERIRKEEEAKAAAKAKAEADALAEQARERIRAEEKAKAEAEAKARPAPVDYVAATSPGRLNGAPASKAAKPATRPAPPRDEIIMLVADKYSVPKTLAARWLHELFAQESA